MKRLATIAVLFASTPALAAEGGMPQLDPHWWPGQILWLAICFVVMYAISSLFLLPAIGGTLDMRRNRIAADIAAGQRLRNEAVAAQTGYEAGLQQSRVEATAIIGQVHNSLKARAEADAQSFRAGMDREIEALEGRLQQARQNAMAEINTVIADIAREAAARITGNAFDEAQARRAVDTLNRREAA